MRALVVALLSAYFLHCAATPTAWHFIDGVNLIFHEAGHAIFIFFGQFIHILMGSGFQVLLPLLISGHFFYTKQRVSGAIALMWAGQSLINVSVYAGDAIVMQLPLLGGDNSFHDWNYLLSTLGILRWTPEIAQTFYATGVAMILAGIGLACVFLKQDYKPGSLSWSQGKKKY